MPSSDNQSPPNDNTVRVLSLNGGGVRGLFTISVLAEIERIIAEKTGSEDVKAGDYFDLISGTSIGGILGLGLAVGKSARELQSVFWEEAPSIFPKRWGWMNTCRAVITSLYSSKPLLGVAETMLGKETRFNDLHRRIVIPSVNLSTGKPQFFKTPHNPDFTRDGPLKLTDAAMATSAAPTYFSPHYCADLGAYFADGGLVANDPSFVALLEVLRDMRTDFPNTTDTDVRILNIGTLAQEYTVSPKALGSKFRGGYIGLWSVGKGLVLTTMTANQQLHRGMLLRELSKKQAGCNLISLDSTIPSEAANEITLDNASESSLLNLKSRGQQVATEEYTKNQALQAFFATPAKPFHRQTSEENS